MGSKSVQGEDRKERVANRELCRWQRSLKSSQPGRACSEEPVGQESQWRWKKQYHEPRWSHPLWSLWAFARAHCDLRRRFAFHWSGLKAGINCARRGSRGGRSPCRGGWLSQWGARRPANRTTIWRSTATASGQEQAGHWWWNWRRQGAADGLRFVWRASFYGIQ